ncbi:IS110 family transposase [Trueperella pecoris]|uniref:IS110 family transposase n=1 Tax=Trueperella pecoris TaxID=2733571 RepID=UPI001ABDB40E|nr:IS110 family transposase [Trueperella pecoris]QTG75984.1 IS110 family transposase [Trueperella pecoris]
MEPGDFKIWLGIDVGKADHWATAVNDSGELVYSHSLPNDESKLRAIYDDLAAQGRLLIVVDQPATIGALAVAVAQSMAIAVAYLPGLAIRRIADLYPGNAKTDQRDAFIIAHAARTMPHTLRTLRTIDEDEAELGMLTGFDDDLARQITQTRNRIRGLLTQIHPGLERVIGPRLDHPAILAMLQTWPVPAALKKAGHSRIGAKLKKHGARRWQAWANEIIDALATQTVTVTGTNAAAIVIPHLAHTLAGLYHQRDDIETQIEKLVTEHPLYPVLTSMPGIGVRTTAVIIAELAGKEFDSAANLASYAGLVPRTRQSGTSIKSENVSHTGNKRLKRALFLSAFASLRADPISRRYYDKKRLNGKRHNQAIIALAHRRLTVIYAMLRDGTFYETQPPKKAA